MRIRDEALASGFLILLLGALGWEQIKSALLADHLVSNLESLATIVALGVGGWWTYSLFIKKREAYPRLSIKLLVQHHEMADDAVLLHVALEIKNIGSTLVILGERTLWVQKVSPLSQSLLARIVAKAPPLSKQAPERIAWPLVAIREASLTRDQCQIEPGESETLYFDFVLHRPLDVICVYAFLKNIANDSNRDIPDGIGWRARAFYRLSGKSGLLVTGRLPEPKTEETMVDENDTARRSEPTLRPSTSPDLEHTRQVFPDSRPDVLPGNYPAQVLPDETPEPEQHEVETEKENTDEE